SLPYLPVLHSFPTRRSSDLHWPRYLIFERHDRCPIAMLQLRLGFSSGVAAGSARSYTTGLLLDFAPSRIRVVSGHRLRNLSCVKIGRATSELQSLAYLVCRL